MGMRVIANTVKARFVELSGTASRVEEFKKVIPETKPELGFTGRKPELGLTGRKPILFVDEIHRFNKCQQGVFLAPIERGEVTL